MFESRIKLVQDSLPAHGVDALLITSSYNIAYLTGIHAFSVEEREARMLITSTHAFLFTDARYVEMVRPLGFVALQEVNFSNPLSKQLQDIIEKENLKTLGFEEENITYREVSELEEKLGIDFIPLSEVVENIRVVKDNKEATFVREACKLTDRGFDFILKHLTPGVTELEIKTQLENHIRLEGGDTAFSSIVAFGKNSAIPHHMSGTTKLQENDIVLLDFGAKKGGYCSDMTRTVFTGKVSDKLKKIYQTTLDSQEVALAYLKQHMIEDFETRNVHEYATSHIRAEGFPPIPHAIGHGVGLQVHELPTLSPYSEERLEPGMVVTVEPGIYLPELGGVRIEDTVLITPSGYEILTGSPKELTVV